MIQKVLQKVFGSKNERDLKRYQPIVEKVNGLAETYALLPEYGGPSIPEILPIAKAATERALQLVR